MSLLYHVYRELVIYRMEEIIQSNISGFLLIDKPTDWTSHDVVAYIRGFVRRNKLIQKKRPKVGHAGTLDPFATGLLIVGVGKKATTQLDTFKGMTKEYIATIRLGATSDTYDKTGVLSEQRTILNNQISEKDVKATLASFIGKQSQLPPMYSAKKIYGKKLYTLARKGIEIEREPSEIEIYEIELLNVISSDRSESRDLKAIEIRVTCSSGTYIRTLAHDIGQNLGTGAYCEELRRTKIGKYRVEDAVEVEKVTVHHLQKLIVESTNE